MIPVIVLTASIGLVGCSKSSEGLVVYSGRNKNLIGPLLDRFEDDTGIDVRVKYADTGESLATLLEEGDRTDADVFISQDAGALGVLSERRLLAELPTDVLALVEERCLLYTSPSPRDISGSRMPSSA